ncbi:MAG: glycosyltransferase family 9 protein [Candidatus Niyogibacteria bacterium]|nr:glycosyltransferase family 9 protein [Candidatus Niyogibacteria bacterium]
MLGVILAAPFFFLFTFLRKRKREKNKPLRILIIPQLTRIGDVVCATPLFREIKKAYPESFLAVLTTAKIEGIIRSNPHIDEFIIYRSSDLSGLFRRIRELYFDWSFILPVSPFGILVSVAGLIPNRVKLVRRPRPPSEICTDWLSHFRFRYHHHTSVPRAYLQLLRYIRIYDPDEKKEVYTLPHAEEKARRLFRDWGVGRGDTVVGISIVSGNTVKEWGDEKWKELARRIAKTYNAKILFLGTRRDEGRIDALRNSLGDDSVFLKEIDSSLEELPSLIKKLSLYIAVDTGPIYIAHALGIPLVDIIGPVDSKEQPPEDEKSIQVLPLAMEPSSFVFKKSGSVEKRKAAVDAISVEQVMDAVDEMMKKLEKS